MNLHWIDWTIVFGFMLVLLMILGYCQKYVKNTADFLAANRCAGRYILAIAGGISSLGAITVIGLFEMYYNAGFTPVWWNILYSPITLLISISGWVFYRLRETRVLTLAQFFEVRYSKNFRIFTGILAWVSGIINYGIFPAISTRFFIYYCGLPLTYNIGNFECSTYPSLLLLFIGIGVIFATAGGQIAIMITDFFQGIFCNIALLSVLVFLFLTFSWDDIFLPLMNHAKDVSLINPFKTSKLQDFNVWFFMIGIFTAFYASGAWQGSQGYQVAAKSPHESKMARFLGEWRAAAQLMLMLFIPICAYAVMHNPAFSNIAGDVNNVLNGLGNPQLQKQMVVPVVLAKILPIGLVGMFAAVMAAAMISTDNTYMHSWGSIFVQDIIMPFRKKPLSPKRHIWMLRSSIIFVGIFTFCFSYLFRQTEYIFLFFIITAAIFIGGAGSVIIGGLYWKKGTTSAAWAAMVSGSVLSVTGIILGQIQPSWFLDPDGHILLNGQWCSFIAIIISSLIYVIVSLISRTVKKSPDFNVEKMLHRGKYDIKQEHLEGEQPISSLKVLGVTKEFSRKDKFIYIITLFWIFGWFLIFICGTIYQMIFGILDSTWILFWKFEVWIGFGLGIIVTVWFCIGGAHDIISLFKTLKSISSNDDDDGRIVDGHNAGE